MAYTAVPEVNSLPLAVAHAATFLTSQLLTRYSATTVLKLQYSLEANLKAHYAPTWVPSDPAYGSGRRCLTLSPNCDVPPRPIYASCIAAVVEWSQWVKTLGNVEFDLFVDPGCVSIRCSAGGEGTSVAIWSAEAEAEEKRKEEERQERVLAGARVTAVLGSKRQRSSPKTFAQQIMDDEDDDEIFALIDEKVREPAFTPTLDQFPAPPSSIAPHLTVPTRRTSPSSISSHSRSSSRSSSSDASSLFSFASASSLSSYSQASASECFMVAPEQEQAQASSKQLSRRERACQAKVFVDESKTEVTKYEGGRTTVLTGGVMLGGASSAKPKSAQRKTVEPSATANSHGSWRRA